MGKGEGEGSGGRDRIKIQLQYAKMLTLAKNYHTWTLQACVHYKHGVYVKLVKIEIQRYLVGVRFVKELCFTLSEEQFTINDSCPH